MIKNLEEFEGLGLEISSKVYLSLLHPLVCCLVSSKSRSLSYGEVSLTGLIFLD